VTNEDKLQLATEAINAHGSTALTELWYARWAPHRYSKYGLPTTVQYSLSCFLMDHAAMLLRGDMVPGNAPPSTGPTPP
jgi:hypothetical protein